MKLRFTLRSLRHLDAVRAYIGSDNPAAANRAVARIRTAIEGLRRYPQLGRIGRVAGTRELIVSGTPYVTPYRVIDDTVEILAVMHGARAWPRSGFRAPPVNHPFTPAPSCGGTGALRAPERPVTRKELLERLEAVQAALGPRAPKGFNSSLFSDAALLKRIEAFETQVGEPEKPKVADYTGNMFSRIANRRAAGGR